MPRNAVASLILALLALVIATGPSAPSSGPSRYDQSTLQSATSTTDLYVPSGVRPECVVGREIPGCRPAPDSLPVTDDVAAQYATATSRAGTPNAYEVCGGSVPDVGGCFRVNDAGTPVFLPGPPADSIIPPDAARATWTAAASATCVPGQTVGCVQTPANALREHWTATAEARP